MGYRLGIDLGTTYTGAAVCRSADRRWVEPEVVTLGTRNATVPSVIYLGPDGSVLVGESAERRSLTDPDRVVREFKRRVGDPTPLVVGGRAWTPEELSARLVRWVVDRVAEREGGPADRIAVTHPAAWGAHKKNLLAGALAGQGLTVTFLAEPQAAALHYATSERVGPGSAIAVYDLGGGTFDAAVVRKADPGSAASGPAGFGLLGRPEGLERLGGVDFDEFVFEHVRDGLPGAFADLDDTDPAVLAAVSRIRRDCTEAKEALSSDTDVSIPVLLPASRGSVRLHRSEFESMIRPALEETVDALRRAITSAGLTPEELSAVLLVGGSSRIPLVAQLVSEQLGRPVAVDADPKNAIAKGAALAVSPKPTASWPGVAIAPVPAGPALAAGPVAAGFAASPGAAPPRLGPPPRGADRTPPRRPSREPATAMRSGGVPPPARPSGPSWPPVPEPSRQPERSRDHGVEPGAEPEVGPERRRRPVGLLVGIGGLLAVAMVVAVLLLGQSGTNFGTVDQRSPSVATSSQVPPVDPAPTGDASGGAVGGGGSQGGGSQDSGSGSERGGSQGGGSGGAPTKTRSATPRPTPTTKTTPTPTVEPTPTPVAPEPTEPPIVPTDTTQGLPSAPEVTTQVPTATGETGAAEVPVAGAAPVIVAVPASIVAGASSAA